jgi:hypothetical protein
MRLICTSLQDSRIQSFGNHILLRVIPEAFSHPGINVMKQTHMLILPSQSKWSGPCPSAFRCLFACRTYLMVSICRSLDLLFSIKQHEDTTQSSDQYTEKIPDPFSVYLRQN